MILNPNWSKFRWFGGVVLILSVALAGCDDDRARDEPMRSMGQTPLPKVTSKALSSSATGERTLPASTIPVGPARQTAAAKEPRAANPEQAKPSVSHADGGFAVKRLVLTSGIKDKEPLPTEAFASDGTPVIAFVELSNPNATDAEIEIVFEHESGRRVGFVKLDVPGDQQRWRTWGQTRQIRESGRWVAVVRSGDGQELMRKAFAVGAG